MASLAWVIGNVHVPLPEQAPRQPVNTEPAAAVGVNETVKPLEKVVEQVDPQLIPDGELTIVPLPTPVRSTLSPKVPPPVPETPNVAVTLLVAVMLSPQVLVPLHDPLQPEKTEPLPGEAVSVTCVPLEKLAEQFVPQLIPLGTLETEPVPLPDLVTPRE